jgi:hypothetical protein
MWQQIKEEIFENEQMDIYEKMCLLVLVGLGDEVNLTSEMLAKYMGCTVVTARKAFEALHQKGYLHAGSENRLTDLENKKIPVHIRLRESNVISEPELEILEDVSQIMLEPVEHFREGFFKDLFSEAEEDLETSESDIEEVSLSPEEEDRERRERLKAYLLGEFETQPETEVLSKKTFVSVKSSKESLVDQVIGIIDEKISFKEANIILGFAGNDIEKIKRKYRIAKMSQLSDTVSVLINELQKRDSNVIKSEALSSETQGEEAEPLPSKINQGKASQVDTYRIQKMQAYQKQNKGK